MTEFFRSGCVYRICPSPYVCQRECMSPAGPEKAAFPEATESLPEAFYRGAKEQEDKFEKWWDEQIRLAQIHLGSGDHTEAKK